MKDFGNLEGQGSKIADKSIILYHLSDIDVCKIALTKLGLLNTCHRLLLVLGKIINCQGDKKDL